MRRRRPSREASVLGLVLLLLPGLGGEAMAQDPGDGGDAGDGAVSTLPVLLPYRADNIAAAAFGDVVYLFGGAAFDEGPGGSDHILRFDPATGQVTTLQAKLPVPVYKPLAVTAGDAIYVMGGVSNFDHVPQAPVHIARFEPATETLSVMDAELPWGIRWGAAAWDGRYVDVFGGCVNSEPCNVIRYDPAMDQVTLGAPTLDGDGPWRIQEGVAFALGPLVYLFGAQDRADPLQGHRLVLLYDSVSDTLAELPGHLPIGRQGASAAWDGRRFLLFGGINNTGQGGLFESTILAFDPLTLNWDLSCARLPAPTEASAAAWVGGAAYVFAGDTRDHRHLFRVRSHLLSGPDCASPLSRPTVPIAAEVAPEQALSINVTPAVQLGLECDLDGGTWEAGVQVARVAADLALEDGSIQASAGPAIVEAATPENAAGAGLYVQVDSRVAGCEARIRLELQADDLGPDAQATDLAIHYYNGTEWVDLSRVDPGTVVAGATSAQDLLVHASGFDAVARVAWADVDHASVYSLGRAGEGVLPEPAPFREGEDEDDEASVEPREEGPADAGGDGGAGDEDGGRGIPSPGAYSAIAALGLAALAQRRRGGGPSPRLP